jgi:hypothetical protein
LEGDDKPQESGKRDDTFAFAEGTYWQPQHGFPLNLPIIPFFVASGDVDRYPLFFTQVGINRTSVKLAL